MTPKTPSKTPAITPNRIPGMVLGHVTPPVLATAPVPELRFIPIDQILESDDNPRKHFDPAFIAQVAASMRQVGQLTPATVRPHPTKAGAFELAAGATRFRAAREAGLPVLICAVRAYDDAEFLEVLTFENLQRRDLRPLEEARSYALLMKRIEGYTVERIAEKSGVSPDYVRDRLRLLQLVPEAVALLDEGRIQLGHALELAKIGATQQRQAIHRGAGGLWAPTAMPATDELGLVPRDPFEGLTARSVRELRSWIDRNVRVDLAHPELPQLLPDTAEALARAKQAQRKVVFIAFGYVDPRVKGDEKVYGPLSWKKADGSGTKAKACEHAALGVVYAGDAARGRAFDVCVAKEKCATHWPDHVRKAKARTSGGKAGAGATKADTAAAERARLEKERQALEQRARQAREQAIEAALPRIKEAMCAAIAKANAVTLGRELIDQILRGWESDKKLVAKIPGTDAAALLRRAWLANELRDGDLFTPWGMQNQLPGVAKKLGLNLTKLLAEVLPTACTHCGCTEETPCDLGGEPCAWASTKPPVCSAPVCLDAQQRSVAAQQKAAGKAGKGAKKASGTAARGR